MSEQPTEWCIEELTPEDLANLTACQDSEEAGWGDEEGHA